jgi:hypothetical protein
VGSSLSLSRYLGRAIRGTFAPAAVQYKKLAIPVLLNSPCTGTRHHLRPTLTMLLALSLSLLTIQSALATPLIARADPSPVNVTTCNGSKYTYTELAGFGTLKSNFRDKYGDTLGGIGSAIALDQKSAKYKKNKGVYEGIIYGLPDRGWNTQGTQNTQSRIHKFSFQFEVVRNASVERPAGQNFKLEYLDTVLLTGPDGKPLTGLDPTTTVEYEGFPELPLAKCM